MARERRSDKERFKYGMCLNEDGGCSKCKSKEIQQIPMRKDFVCAECGLELRECPPPPTKTPTKLIAIIAGAVAAVAALGTGGYFLFSNNEAAAPSSALAHSTLISSISADGWNVTPDDLAIVGEGDTIWFEALEGTDVRNGVTPSILLEDSAAVLEPASVIITEATAQTVVVKVGDESKQYVMAVKKAAKKETSDKPTTTNPDNTTTGKASYVSLKCGTYEGPMSGRTPDGIGGTIRVTRSYSIDLKNADHEYVEISPGDEIVDTKFTDGVLKQGLLKRSNGEQKFLTGISERL